jgi:DinB superfamily
MEFMDRDQDLRRHLIALLNGKQAHLSYDDVVRGWPLELRGVRPEGAAHSSWEVLEHLRICQRDILDFSRDPDYESPEWPAGYWPPVAEPPDEDAWDRSVEAFRSDLAQMKALVEDQQQDLFQPFDWGDGQTLLREAMLVADHNSYHLGELMALKKRLIA